MNHIPSKQAPLVPEIESSFIEAIERRSHERSAGRTRQWRLAYAGVAAAIGASVAVFGGMPSSSVSVLEQAQAALSPANQLIHYVATAHPVAVSGGLSPKRIEPGCKQTGRVEVWQATKPNRWRAILPGPPNSPGCGRIFDPRRGVEITGRTEVSWNQGVSSWYDPASGALDIVRGYPANSTAGEVPLGNDQLGSGDPVGIIRRLLATKAIREAGKATLHGREVLVLKGSSTHSAGGRSTSISAVYAVDRESYAPVRVITTTTVQDPSVSPALQERLATPQAQQIDFTGYRRQTLTTSTRRLLSIRPTRPAKTIDQTLGEFRRSNRERSSR